MTVHQDVMIERTEDIKGIIYTVMETQFYTVMRTEKLTDTLKHIIPAWYIRNIRRSAGLCRYIDKRLRMYKTRGKCVLVLKP